MKYGAPIADVNTPAGTSSGENAVRAIKSAPMTSSAPIKAEVGINAPNEEPTSFLEICGAIKPTKPTPPTNATAPPASAVLNNSRIILSF